MAPTAKPTGLLLAGGRSSRMGSAFAGGQGDKALLELAGRPMLSHVRERLDPQAGRLVISANGDPARFASFGLPVVADTITDFAGPLAGILAGLRWSEENAPGARHIVTASTDAPFLPVDLVARLTEALNSSDARIALAQSAGRVHPVIGLWSIDLANDLEAALNAGCRKVESWTNRHPTVTVDFPGFEHHGRTIDPFFNVNSPDDLAEAQQILSR